MKFKMPAEALSIAKKRSQDNIMAADCSHPKISFIIYENNKLFRDVTVQETGRDVSQNVVSAKVGGLKNVSLYSSKVQFTLPLMVSQTFLYV